MAFVKKTWKNRLTEYATRRILTNLVTGEVSTMEVARSEGEVYEEGDSFNADTMNDLETRIKNAFTAVLLETYPVGSIKISTNNVNPSTYLGGTWVAWGTGKVPVGIDTTDSDFNTSEKTGGSKSHSYTPSGSVTKPSFTGTQASLSHSGGSVSSHKLTEDEIPKHDHYIDFQNTYTTYTNPDAHSHEVVQDWGGGVNASSAYLVHQSGHDPQSTGVGFTSQNISYYVATDNYVGNTQAGSHRHKLDLMNKWTNMTGGNGSHDHGFTQPSAHTYTPAGSVSQPSFNGTASTQSHVQPYITCYMWKRTA